MPNSNPIANQVATHVAAISPSGIREFFELVQGRPDVISLGVGEPDFATPWHIREASIYALERGKTSYTSNLGLLKLREAISHYVAQYFGPVYRPDNEILITVGVSEALDPTPKSATNCRWYIWWVQNRSAPCLSRHGQSHWESGIQPRPTADR